jgi:beta-mannosidase
MDLGGRWRAVEADEQRRREFHDPDLDDSGWSELPVPGHWRSSAAFATSDGPLLYRRRFEAPATEGRRAWLVLDGVFYQADVWLDGTYLGDTEGYFFPSSFEATALMAERREHLLAVEVACAAPGNRRAKRNLTGVFQHWDCIDHRWNPGGLWAPVHLEWSGPVHLSSLRVSCREANDERAVIDLGAVLDADTARTVTVRTTLRRGEREATVEEHAQTLAAGDNRVHWRVSVRQPDLWWPRALGDQPLYDLDVEVLVDGVRSDVTHRQTGLRQIRMRDFLATVNGERIFLKGANLAPTRRALGEATPAELAADIDWAQQAGLDLVRVHAHVSRPELYEAADRAGMLVWQDLPLQWGYAGVRRQAMRQAGKAVSLLGHHPSIAVWCGHNEPFALDLAPGQSPDRSVAWRWAAQQILPTRNKTTLDRSIRWALERADPSRPVVAHSGVVPHPAGGTDSHLYFGWYHGEVRGFAKLMARLPVMARFVSEFGAQAVPANADFCEPERWPDLDWERLGEAHALQRTVFEERIPPGAYSSFADWRAATQQYQAEVLRFHIETLRRLKYRPTGGFCLFALNDAQPAVSWSILDHERAPKSAFAAVQAACAPVVVVADRPAASYVAGQQLTLDVHVVSDRREPLPEVTVEVRLAWPGGGRSWRFGGSVGADSCVRVGRLQTKLAAPAGPLNLSLVARWGDGPHDHVTSTYSSEITARERPRGRSLVRRPGSPAAPEANRIPKSSQSW